MKSTKSKAKYFQFSSYKVAKDRKTLKFHYSVGLNDQKRQNFSETLVLPQKIVFRDANHKKLIESCLQNLHLMLGISYWKMYCPPKIIISTLRLSKKQSEFWNTVYTKGLAEFFYKNKIDFRSLIKFPFKKNISIKTYHLLRENKALIGIGGGKDSAVAVEMLKEKDILFKGFVVESSKNTEIIRQMTRKMGIKAFIIDRKLDPQLLRLNKTKGVFNGHVPISALQAFIALLLGVLYGYAKIFTANEQSANEGNVSYLGTTINHQWSKSEEFEKLFQIYINQFITPEIIFKSIIRSLSEIQIMQIFSKLKKYHPIFSSCNVNFRIQNATVQNKRWCGDCPKCLFVFILLAAFLPKKEVLKIFSENLLDKISLLSIFKQLTGREGSKPFECVGTAKEVKMALSLIRRKKEFTNDYLMKQ